MIKRKNLDPSLVSWIQNESGLGPGVGNVVFLAPTKASTAQYASWLESMGIDDSDLFINDLPAAYSALVAGRNDVLVVMPGNYTQTAAFVWGKDYTHMIGACAPTHVNQRCRFSAATAALSPMITFSADGSIMKNILWSQEGSNATTAAICCAMTGDRNYLENVTFRNLGALAVVNASMRNLRITSSNGENTYYKCTIGADTFDAVTAASSCIEYAGTYTGRDLFEQCRIMHGGSSSGLFLTVGANALQGFIEFRECLFSNNTLGSMDAMTQAFNISASANGFVFSIDNLIHGASAYETSNSGMLVGRHAYAAATTDLAVLMTY